MFGDTISEYATSFSRPRTLLLIMATAGYSGDGRISRSIC